MSAAVSVVLHVVLGAAFIQLLVFPTKPIQRLLGRDSAPKPAAERITYVTVPPVAPPVAAQPRAAPRSGGDGRTPAPRPTAPLVAPREVPATLPPPAAEATPAPSADGTTPGSGPLVGRGGPTRGVEPSYSDGRIWAPAPSVANAPKTADARMDSVVASGIQRYADSVAANTYTPNKFERGDWTVERDGKKYGIDQQYIRLGKVSIPLPLLALLPINAQGNPIAYQRERELASLRAEIQYHSQRALNEQEFRKAVKALRERKERERQQREAEKERPIASPAGSGRSSP